MVIQRGIVELYFQSHLPLWRFLSKKLPGVASAVILLNAFRNKGIDLNEERKDLEVSSSSGVFSSEPSVVNVLVSDHIVSSFPIFEKLFTVPASRGRQAKKDFVTRFCNQWTEARISIQDAVAEEDRVVLIRSFRTRRTGSNQQGGTVTN